MRTLFLALATISFTFISCGGESSDEKKPSTTTATNPAAVEVTEGTPEVTAKQIADYIISNNNQALMELIITQEEMTRVISESSVTSMGKEVAIRNIPTEISKMRVDYTNGMTDIRKQCEASGIEWSNCKFKDVTYEMNNPTGYFMAQLLCVLECNGMEYKFTVTDVVQTEGGWKLGGTMYFGDVPPQPVKK